VATTWWSALALAPVPAGALIRQEATPLPPTTTARQMVLPPLVTGLPSSVKVTVPSLTVVLGVVASVTVAESSMGCPNDGGPLSAVPLDVKKLTVVAVLSPVVVKLMGVVELDPALSAPLETS
jgi:hypothetical protein